MKKVLFLVLASFLVLAACGQKEESKPEAKKSEAKKKESENKKKDEKAKEDNKKETAEKQPNSNPQTKENDNTEQASEQKIPQVNLGNITDRNTLVSVINGNYSEKEKIQAYNSAVANGVIPQGNVTEGPASDAYQSSLRVENGTEKSMYEQSQDNGAKHQQDTTPYEKEYTDDGHEKYNNDFSNDQINEEQSNLDNLLEKGTISQEQYDEWSNQIRN